MRVVVPFAVDMQFIPLANYLRRYRKRHNLSQGDVAAVIPVRSRSAIARHELDERLPDLRTALAYAALYGVSVETLFAGVAREVAAEVDQRVADAARLRPSVSMLAAKRRV